MKKATLFIAFILCFSGTANAQFFKKLGNKIEKAAEKTIEKKAVQKTTKETEEAFDSTINKKAKKDKNKKQTSTPNVSKVDPASNYAFKHKAVMHMKSGKDEIDFVYYLPNTDDYFGMAIKDKKEEQDFMMVYDVAREAMFTFMENGGQKMKMGVEFKTNTVEDKSPGFEIKATGNTKTVLGYNCKEYKMIGDNITATTWVTKDVNIRFPSTLYNDKKNNNNSQEWMKDIDGWAMEMTMIDTSKRKPQTIIMNCLSIEAYSFKINSTDYKHIGY